MGTHYHNTRSVVLVQELNFSFSYSVESPNKGHFGTNINSSGLSPV